MELTIKRTLHAVAAVTLSAVTFGAASLHLDGILRVDGMPLRGARVIVVSSDAEPMVFTDDLSHFTMDLALQTEYLVSFERPGCVSKQLSFDTKVPAAAVHSGGFRFPFQVTLAPPPDGRRNFAYAGPVGHIRFDPAINDFGYDTDYRAANSDHDILAHRLEVVRSNLIRGASKAVPVSVAMPATAPALPAKEPVKAVQEELAPMAALTPPMVHVLEKPAPASKVPRTTDAGATTAATPATEAMRLPAPTDHGRSREVHADKLHVITVIRVKDGDRTDEYRKVVSYYGGTIYFCNGHACSAERYARATGH